VVAAPVIVDTITISAPANTAAPTESAEIDTRLAAALPAAPAATPVLNTATPQTQDNAALDALLASAAPKSDAAVTLEQLSASLAENTPVETPRPVNDVSNAAILADAALQASQQSDTALPAPSAADSAETEQTQPLPPQAPVIKPVAVTPATTTADAAATIAPLAVQAVQETVRPKNTPAPDTAKTDSTAAAATVAAASPVSDQELPQQPAVSPVVLPAAANDDQATLAAPVTAAPQTLNQNAPQPAATQYSNLETAPTSNADTKPATSADTLTAPTAEQKTSAAPQPTDKPADKPAAPALTTTAATDQPAPQTTPTPAPPPAPLAAAASAIPPALAAHAVYGNSAGHEQIAYAMKKATDDGTQNITIRLRPHQLGLVDIQMTVSADGKIQAVLAADKPETLFWLQQDAKQLERSLQDSGLKTDSTSLSFQFRGDSGTGGYSSNQNSRNEHQNAPIEARQREVNNPSAETAEQPERSGVSTRPGALNMRV
ncbi:MAG: flagellar hook-length control protein FliK, partial [Holosporales bacterium]